MRLLTFATLDRPLARLGIELEVAGTSVVVNAQQAYERTLLQAMSAAMAARFAAALIPNDMRQMLEGGDDSLRALRTVHAYAVDQLRAEEDVSCWARQGLAVNTNTVVALPPVAKPGKILAVGSNFSQQPVSEAGRSVPVVFAKLPNCLVPNRATVGIPAEVDDVDFEGELVAIIGRPGHGLTAESALDYVAGYTIVNDLTRRNLLADERARGAILFGKNFVGSAPCGPVLVTSDEIPDPQRLTIRVTRNCVTDSQAPTSEMVWTVAELVALCSQIPLEPGDLIMTGAPKRPAGSSAAPCLADGDRVAINIPPVGELVTTFARPAPAVGSDRQSTSHLARTKGH